MWTTALRGHCDNGNVLSTSKFQGDTVLGEHLKAAAKNVTYTSPVILNQIIDVLEDQIRSEIIRRVQKAKWFTVMAD